MFLEVPVNISCQQQTAVIVLNLMAQTIKKPAAFRVKIFKKTQKGRGHDQVDYVPKKAS